MNLWKVLGSLRRWFKVHVYFEVKIRLGIWHGDQSLLNGRQRKLLEQNRSNDQGE